jgi:hypothetical protein
VVLGQASQHAERPAHLPAGIGDGGGRPLGEVMLRHLGIARLCDGTEQRAGDPGGCRRGQQRRQAGHPQAGDREAVDGPADIGQVQPDDQSAGIPAPGLTGDRERRIVGTIRERDVLGPVADRLGDLQPALARGRWRGRARAYQHLAAGRTNRDA